MRDQAAELRNLVLRAARQTRTDVGSLPRLTWFFGAQPGVGTTSLSVSIAELLAHSGYRGVLINGRRESQRFTTLTRTHELDGDWLVQRKEIHEVMQAGLAGLQVVTGLGESIHQGKLFEQRHWLHRQLCTLRPYSDFVIVESDRSADPLATDLTQWATELVVVTEATNPSIMNAYAGIKACLNRSPIAQIGVLINRTRDAEEAKAAWDRMERSCRQFLDFQPILLGYLPEDERLGAWFDRRQEPRGAARSSLDRLQAIGQRLINRDWEMEQRREAA